MAANFTIPERAFDGFSMLVELGPDKVRRLGELVEGSAPTLDLDQWCRAFAAELPEVDAERLLRTMVTVLVPLSGLRSEFGTPPAEFVRQVGELLSRQQDWWAANSKTWEAVAPVVEGLVAAGGKFALQSKIAQLLTTRSALAPDFRLLTELRPVFDDTGGEVAAFILTTTLVVGYDDESGGRQVHIDLDRRDLDALRAQIDRAVTKAESLERRMAGLNVPVLTAGAG